MECKNAAPYPKLSSIKLLSIINSDGTSPYYKREFILSLSEPMNHLGLYVQRQSFLVKRTKLINYRVSLIM
jgi:hypothetical protein